MMDKTIILECDCGCGALKITKYDDEDIPYGFQYYAHAFYEKQGTAFDLIWARIKAAWFMLRGKDYYFYDMIIKKDKFKEFANFVESIK